MEAETRPTPIGQIRDELLPGLRAMVGDAWSLEIDFFTDDLYVVRNDQHCRRARLFSRQELREPEVLKEFMGRLAKIVRPDRGAAVSVQKPTITAIDKWFQSDRSFPDFIEFVRAACLPSSVGEPGMPGGPYVEIAGRAMARPNDVEVLKRYVLDNIMVRLVPYLSETEGRTYWCVYPEDREAPACSVSRFDEDGPDIDFETGRRCFLDRNWIAYSVYMRLFRSAKAEERR